MIYNKRKKERRPYGKEKNLSIHENAFRYASPKQNGKTALQ